MTAPTSPPDVEALVEVATTIAQEASALLVEGLGRARSSVRTKSSATDMVTEMDRASEALLVERLRTLRPGDAIVGEEGTDDPGTTGVTWVVDPLDGTTNYLYGHPGWNVSVGAVHDGRPVAGAVSVPATGDLYAAAAGHGATCNGTTLLLGTDAPPLAQCLVGTGFNYDPAVRRTQVDVLGRVIDRIRDIRRSGAAAADLCAVAHGRLDAYYETGLSPWDRVAGTVIAREAGAVVEVLEVAPGVPLGADCTIAAHPRRFDELVELLRSAGTVA